MSAPQVYKAINAITAELAPVGVAKRHRNERDDYFYRSIDVVLNRLAPLLAHHKLCVLPRVLERCAADRTGECDQLLVSVVLKVAFDMVSVADGSSHTVEAYGEALDPSDKATAKAMSSAYKHAMLQAFCVPVREIADADASSHRLKRTTHDRCPVEGWEQWAAGISDIAASCASQEALDRLQDRNRPLLNALNRERPDLYSKIGASFARCAKALNGEGCAERRDGQEYAKARSRSHGRARSTRLCVDSGNGTKRQAPVVDRSAAKRRPSQTATKTSIAREEAHAPDALSETP